MNNSVASSTSDVISFRVREEKERNREGGRGRRARLGIIRCSRRTKPLVAASFIVRNRRLTFAVHHRYAIPEAILMPTESKYSDGGIEHTSTATRQPEGCIIYECIKRNYIRSGIKSADFSRSLFSPNAFRKLRIGDVTRGEKYRRGVRQKMQSAFIANRVRSSRIKGYFSNFIVSDRNPRPMFQIREFN